jgi:hypothetical protein
MPTKNSRKPLRRSEAPPRWGTRPRPERPTIGPRVTKLSQQIGAPFMPWQQLVASVAGEMIEDEITGLLVPAYRSVVVTIMRQQGKSLWTLAMELDRAILWDEPQRIAYSAQTGWDARKKLIDDHAPILTSSPLKATVQRVLRGAGNEGIIFKNGSRIEVMASSDHAGHGRTIDLACLDELMADTDDRREQAMLPAMATRPAAQLIIVSTAGTEESTALRRKVEIGRAAAEADTGKGIAYFEWSIPDDADLDDPEVWWSHMPALGWTISEEVVAHARATMSDHEFRRGFANQWVGADRDRIIPAEVWDLVQDPTAAPVAPLTFAVDVQPDRSAASIASSGGGIVELVEHRPGVSWVVQRLVDLQTRWSGHVVLDAGGPAGALMEDLEAAGVNVSPLGSTEVVAACARFYDRVADGQVRIRTNPLLDESVAGLAKRPVGDRFVWSRSTSSADVTPLMAATLALQGPGDVSRPTPFVLTD